MVNQFDKPREYVVRALKALGLVCPARYAEMLSNTPESRVIEGLDPWAFLPVPERSMGYCSEALGQSVLPFAQAVGEDLIACFVPGFSPCPMVIVINPWSEEKGKIIEAECADFDAWLLYAYRISREVQDRDEGLDND